MTWVLGIEAGLLNCIFLLKSNNYRIQYKLEYGILLGRWQKYSIFEFPFYEVK